MANAQNWTYKHFQQCQSQVLVSSCLFLSQKCSYFSAKIQIVREALTKSEFSWTSTGFVAAISLLRSRELWPTALAFPLTHTGKSRAERAKRGFLPIKMSHTAASKDSLRYQFYEATQTWVNCSGGRTSYSLLKECFCLQNDSLSNVDFIKVNQISSWSR